MSTTTNTKDNGEAAVAALTLAGIPVLIGSLIGIILLSSAWNAFVIHKLWNWFALPLGAPAVSWGQVWGLMMIYNLVTYKPLPKQQPDAHPWRTMFVQILIRFCSGAFCLLVGWLILAWLS